MPDITQIEGPAGGPDNVRRQDRSIPDDKFKKAMEPKVTKVTESDADQEAKKKKKSKQEEGIEGEDQVTAGPAPEQPLPSPFSLEAEKKLMSPSELQAGEKKISPLESSQKRAPSPMEAFVEQPPAYTPPSSEEIEDDSGVWGETAEIQESPAQPAPSLPSAPSMAQGTPPQPNDTARPEVPRAAPETTQTQPTTQPTASSTPSSQPPQKQQSSSSAPATPKAPTQQTTPQAPVEPSTPGDVTELLKEIPESASLIGETKPARPLTPAAQTAIEKVEEEAEGTQGIVPVTPTLSPTGATLESDKKKERTIGDTSQSGLGISAESPIPIETPLVPPEAPVTPYMTLTPQVMDLFERMVGVMTVMNSEGLTETTVTLNTPQFASSVFYGTQIIIQEYSTAPKAFNIQIKGTPAAIAAFQGNTNDLMAAFQHGNYNFRVNRLDTSLLDERPLFKRKEKTSNDPDDQPE